MDEQVLQYPGVRATFYKHQAKALELSWNRQHYGLFMEQGTGKTLVILGTLARLWREKKVTGALIICADGLHFNWMREIRQFLDIPEAVPCLWDSSMGKRALANWCYTASLPESQLPILLMNIEALRLERFQETIEGFLTNRRIISVIDESTCIANPKASQSRAAFKVGLHSCYTRILSGTPIRKDLTNLWSQCHYLSPSALPYPSYVTFCSEFTVKQTKNFGGRAFEQIVGFKNESTLIELVSKFSFRVTKAECLDLPPKIYTTIHIPLTPEQLRAYKDLTEKCFIDLPPGPLLIPALLPKLVKFQQICSGWVADEEGKIHAIHSNRSRALANHIELSDKPRIIFCAFREDVFKVVGLLKELGKRTCSYYGDTPSAEREAAVLGFQDGSFDYFVATRAASKGLTLTRAEEVIYYSQGWSLETRLQSEDRAHRIGLTHPVTYVTFCSPGTIDEKIATALVAKRELAEQILSAEDFTHAIAYSEPQAQL